MKHATLVLLMLVAPGWLGAQTFPEQGHSPSGIPFELNRHYGSILLRAQVNGHPATLVLDTGCSRTILSWELLQVRPLALQRAGPFAKGSGYVGTAGWSRATLEVGPFKWPDRKVLVMDFQELSNTMKQSGRYLGPGCTQRIRICRDRFQASPGLNCLVNSQTPAETGTYVVNTRLQRYVHH